MAEINLINLHRNNQDIDNDKQKFQDLFVFGYQCKLFRDDEKAEMIDSGHYLVPWNGNDDLQIDRHDGRGYLMDLSEYDADNIKFEDKLNLEELEIEAACDKERYFEMHVDVTEQEIYEEEEIKRLNAELNTVGYESVNYSYCDSDTNNVKEKIDNINTEKLVSEDESDDEDFIPSPQMDYPLNMILPKKIKEHAIIEKTAKFVAEHGPQIEIMIKTKQKHNNQFLFLEQSGKLFPYYQMLIFAMKSGRYYEPIRGSMKKSNNSVSSNENDDDDNDEDNNDNYLHPSLMSSGLTKPANNDDHHYTSNTLPGFTINSTPYGKLLTSIGKFASINNPIEENLQNYEEKEKVTLQANTINDFNETGDCNNQLKLPPSCIQTVIDKLAEYVAKNGPHFELTVRLKDKERFQFLLPDNPHHSYFLFKREWHLNNQGKDPKTYKIELESIENDETKHDYNIDQRVNLPPGLQAVSFSIKKQVENKSLINQTPITPPNEIDSELINCNAKLQKEKEKVAAKLLQVAREKVAEKNKEKNVQDERKKKAALFANMVKSGVLQVSEVETATSSIPTRNSVSSSLNNEDLRKSGERKNKRRSSRDKLRNRRSKRSRSRSPREIVSKIRSLSRNKNKTDNNNTSTIRSLPSSFKK